MSRAGAMSLADRFGEQVSAGTRNRGLDRSRDDPAESGIAERDREADEADDRLHERERGRVGERAGMAEAVGDAQTHECILEQPAPPASAECLPGVVAREAPRLGNNRRGAHSVTAGTHMVNASW